MLDATYRALLAYDGAGFAGYSRQPGLYTVEDAVRAALARLPAEARALAVAGRTDRGVSATGQVISLRLRPALPPEALREALDGVDPNLACPEVRVVPRAFHAGFSATGRRYAYLLSDLDPALVHRVDRLLAPLVGRRCFSAFARDTRPGQSTVRRLSEARLLPAHEGERPAWAVLLTADGFLRKQVRILVATALREAEAGAPEDRLVALATAGERAATAPPAPPEPLRLISVLY